MVNDERKKLREIYIYYFEDANLGDGYYAYKYIIHVNELRAEMEAILKAKRSSYVFQNSKRKKISQSRSI